MYLNHHAKVMKIMKKRNNKHIFIIQIAAN